MTAAPRGIALQRGLAELRAGRPGDAVPLLEDALREEGPASLAALNLGFALMDSGRLSEAAQTLRDALAAFQHQPELHARLGQLDALRGELDGAGRFFEDALRLNSAYVPALAGLASLATARGDPVATRDLLAEARLHDPHDPALQLRFAAALLACGDTDAAEAEAKSLQAVLPGLVGAGLLRARAMLARLGPGPASEALARAHEEDPFSASGAAALAECLAASGRTGEAIGLWRIAEALSPEDGDALLGLGLALNDSGAREEAAEILARAGHCKPDDVRWRTALAETCFRLHRLSEAAELQQATLDNFGRDAGVLSALALVRCAQGRQEEAVGLAEEAPFRSDLGCVMLGGLLPYHPTTGTAHALHAAALRLKEIFARDATGLPVPPAVQRKRLRVGFLSGSFGTHPVGWLTVAGIEALPRDDFELVLLSLRTLDGPLTRRFRCRADRWVDLSSGLSDQQLAEALRCEELDILVDLGGHGAGGRMSALRHRAAPVQIKWVGSQSGPSGVPNIDFMLADNWEIPQELEKFYTEAPLRLPDGYVCYAAPAYAAEVAPLPALARNSVTFGCFNNLAKVTPRVLASWAQIFGALPGARLVLRTHALGDTGTREAFLARAEMAGLDPARIEVHGSSPHDKLLAAYGDIDISLDPFPYTGGLTVCESLWMGVPVLTLVGGSFAARHAFSHLSNVGLADWAVMDEGAYVAEAIRRAQDIPALARLREGLRARVAESPLCDAPRFGRNLAVALKHAWKETTRPA